MKPSFQVNGINRGGFFKRPTALKISKYHLILETQQQAQLQELIETKAPGVIDVLEFRTEVVRSIFLRQYVDLKQNDALSKWATQYSTPTRIIRQCQCGIYRLGICQRPNIPSLDPSHLSS